VDWHFTHGAWQSSFEHFWEFMRSYGTAYRGWGWRGLLSRLATLMVAFEDSDGSMQLGGRLPAMPSSLVASPREHAKFGVDFDHSIFSRVIEPFCVESTKLQRYYLHTTEVAYVPPGAGALYFEDGRLRTNALALEFVKARAELLDSTKRMLVDLRRVVDPEFRRELVRKGVKLSPVNPALQGSPGLGGAQILKPDIPPPRALSRPKVVRLPPIAGMNELARKAPPRAKLGVKTDKPKSSNANATAIGVAVAGLAVTLAGAALLNVSRDDEPTD